VKYTTSANRRSNNQSKRTNECKVIIKKAIREFLPNTERGRDIQYNFLFFIFSLFFGM
jgi:ribosomal protein L13